MIDVEKEYEDAKIFEFQGTFDNIHLFDGVFDNKTLTMSFKDIILQGKIVKKDFTFFKSQDGKIKEVKMHSEVVLFDKPPRYKL